MTAGGRHLKLAQLLLLFADGKLDSFRILPDPGTQIVRSAFFPSKGCFRPKLFGSLHGGLLLFRHHDDGAGDLIQYFLVGMDDRLAVHITVGMFVVGV